ncbi:MAG: class I SAM-dependent methyltransferase [Spirochaetia bacterium]|nr:class I SAM-dependent methyltransferase [Spirochaetia bacterium]
MKEINIVFDGILYQNKQKIPVKITYGSKNSLLVVLLTNQTVKDNTEFEAFSFTLENKEFKFGRCKIILEHIAPNFSGRLFFLEDVYDFYSIFSMKKTSNLETYFQSMPLILGLKNKIKDSFRKYTSNLTYDLRVYRKYFDELDKIYEKEPPAIYKETQNIIIEKEGRKFFNFFDEKLEELKSITSEFTLEEHETHAYYFRRQVWDIIISSSFLTRTNVKPRGYAGDSEMMSMIYENSYEGESIFSKLMHKHPIETKSAKAVRNRKTMIPVIIARARKNFEQLKDKFNILSVACGPTKELENILISPLHCEDYHFTLLDQDQEALNEAENSIKEIENRFNSKIHYKLITDSVRTMLREKDLQKKIGTFHFIYSMGLFDYLSTRVAQAILEKLYSLLKPGGWMIIGNYHEKNSTKIYMDYWGDWVLYYRSEEELKKLADNIEANFKAVVFEDTKCQMFLVIEKPV